MAKQTPKTEPQENQKRNPKRKDATDAQTVKAQSISDHQTAAG